MGTPHCFACGRIASRFDRQIGEWCCQGNADCGMSMGVTREQREKYERDRAALAREKDK